MPRLTKAQYKKLGLTPPKTVAQFRAEYRRKAKALPVETKRTFWQAWLDGKKLGDAAGLAGIEDVCVAAELHGQCHEKITYHRPKTIDEIT